ncbi:hypothetical protein [Arthrobacter globiformis]|uniref:hypothetical protein n=1 Tax=Arthrobacter globiformis TaxID=1665 RepID=UPI0027889313|nr:hypothetical protein [Arthrobacter globiformis]MDQ0865709.1 hypothetical protein [Arthrobacter globiformis]
MTTAPTHELIAASERYAETLREWAKVHLAWFNGEVDITKDREAYAAREAAFTEFKRVESELEQESRIERVVDHAIGDYEPLADEPNA